MSRNEGAFKKFSKIWLGSTQLSEETATLEFNMSKSGVTIELKNSMCQIGGLTGNFHSWATMCVCVSVSIFLNYFLELQLAIKFQDTGYIKQQDFVYKFSRLLSEVDDSTRLSMKLGSMLCLCFIRPLLGFWSNMHINLMNWFLVVNGCSFPQEKYGITWILNDICTSP